MTYTMTWTDHYGHRCVLTIRDTSDSSQSGTVELTPAADPFVTQEDRTSNPFTPVRTQTGIITFIANGQIPYVSSSHQWRVTLMVSRDIRWTGWLKGETLNQQYDSTNHEVRLNCIDDLAAMETWMLDEAAGFGLVTLREMVVECLRHADDEDNMKVYMPNTARTENLRSVLALSISRYNFFTHIDSGDSDDENQREYEPDTCLAFLQKLCKFFGWSMRKDGYNVYFSCIGTNSYVYYDSLDSFEADTVTSIIQRDAAASLVPDAVGSDHTITYEPGHRRIAVVAELNKIESSIPALDFENCTVDWVQRINGIEYADHNGSHYENYDWMVRYMRPASKFLHLHKLWDRHSSTGTDHRVNESEVEEYPDQVRYSQQLFGQYMSFDEIGGAHIISHDWWVQSEGASKINYDLRTRLVLSCRMPVAGYGNNHIAYRMNSVGIGNIPLLEAESPAEALYTSGGFEVRYSMHVPFLSHIGYSSLTGYYAAGNMGGPSILGNNKDIGQTHMYKWFRLKMSLQIGEYYWNGSEWTTTPSTFYATQKMDNGEAQSLNEYKEPQTNKTLDMNFTSVGVVMPITTPMFGRIRFAIYSIGGITSDDSNWRYVEMAYLDDLSVGYCQPLDLNGNVNQSLQSHTYSRIVDGWTEDMGDITVNMCSNNSDGANYSQLSYNNIPVTKLQTSDMGMVRPELHLLNKYVQHYGTQRTVLSVRCSTHEHTSPMKWYALDGRNYEIISHATMNWLTCEAEYIMKDYD